MDDDVLFIIALLAILGLAYKEIEGADP